MLDDIRKTIRSIHQSYVDQLDLLVVDFQQGRISGDEYRARASARRNKFFEDDKAAHAELAERAKGIKASDLPESPLNLPKQ